MRAEDIFAGAYLLCALIAATASRTRPTAVAAAARPFWLRIAIICGAFAILRLVDAQMTVSGAIGHFSHSAGLTNWKRPGPYLMILTIAAVGIALVGLYVFRLRDLHRSMNSAALAIGMLILLAIAHSLSLNVTGAFLQREVGPLTVSRMIEVILLLALALSGAWFIADARNDSKSFHQSSPRDPPAA